jgi:hypothetical protein
MSYQPEWSDEVLGWATKYLAKQVWRIRPMLELDDALQESYLLFLRLTERYDFESPQHFMAMWKRCLSNKVHGWACERTNMHQEHLSNKMLNDIPDRTNDALWEHHEAKATGYVRQLLRATRTRIRRPRRRHSDGTRLTTNEYLCRFAGISAKVPLRRLFERWLLDV